MTEVTLVATPSLEGKRLAFALAEDRVAHYPEFRDFFVRTFDLDRKGLAEPGFVRTLTGNLYAFIFIGRSGAPFPSGLEIHGVVDGSNLLTALSWTGISGRFCVGLSEASGLPGPWKISIARGACIACRQRRPPDIASVPNVRFGPAAS